MQLSDYLEQLVIDHLLRGQAYTPSATVYLALFEDATDDAGGGTEAAGGSYTRKALVLGAPSGGAASNTAVLTFSNMPAGTWTHGAIMDAAGGGNMLAHGALVTPKTTDAGGVVAIAVGDVDLSFTSGSHASTYLRNLIIDRFFRNQAYTPTDTYMALYTSAVAEVVGGTYARQLMALVDPAGGVTSNGDEVQHTGMPAVTVTHAGLHDDVAAGNQLTIGPVASPAVYAAADVARWPIGEYTLTVR